MGENGKNGMLSVDMSAAKRLAGDLERAIGMINDAYVSLLTLTESVSTTAENEPLTEKAIRAVFAEIWEGLKWEPVKPTFKDYDDFYYGFGDGVGCLTVWLKGLEEYMIGELPKEAK